MDTDPGKNSSRNVTYEQRKTLIDFMVQHVDFATGSLRSLEARQTSKMLWTELTNLLNNVQFGSKKSSYGWSKYWSDYKNKLKTKIIMMRSSKRGGSVDKRMKPFTRLEKRAVVILGPHFAKKTRQRAITDPFKIVETASLPKIKQESFLDELNGFPQGENQQSEADKDSNMSDDSDEEIAASDDQAINSLYPKWLINVEKKRAEAELIRAKAEMQKADVAQKNAEAALMQAQSLKKLSEVAEMQAESMLRIASALENLVQNRNILEL
ncbi:uncharacterized protein LOC121729252 isoform X2 [Aricia agestis]|uniref:uncharacterized protein LOC121729252 isoform X2 n=1 Tax=Aricia agestis TaxID=91739 RepID=UPI001C205E47|nr:uncharacterized protein LOC121729252 isoform X2 [Aricia agestis]